MPFCFHTFMPMKRNMSFAGFRLCYELCYELSSWFITDIVDVKNNVFFGFVYCFPSYFCCAYSRVSVALRRKFSTPISAVN